MGSSDYFSPFRVKHSVSFGELNAEAQRNYPNRVKPPYLTWHIATWPDFDKHPLEASTAEKRRELRKAWIGEVNKFMEGLAGRRVQKFARDEYAGESGDERHPREVSRGEVITIEGLADAPAVLLRAELHHEYASFTFILPITDPSCPNPPERDSPILLDEARGQQAMRAGEAFNVSDPEVDTLVTELWDRVQREKGEDNNTYRDRVSENWDHLYTEAWHLAFQQKSLSALQLPGCLFCNFRGIVLPRDWLVKAYTEPEACLQYKYRSGDGKPDRPDGQFVSTDLEGLPRIPDGAPPTPIENEEPRPTTPKRWNRVSAGRCLVRNLAFRHALHWVGGKVPKEADDDPSLQRRTVASLMIDGRALFVSAFSAGVSSLFGAQADEQSADVAETTSRFALFYCPESDEGPQELLDRRLDRLVLRLHLLGTLRLIALKDIGQLNYIAPSLEELSDDIVATAELDKSDRISIKRVRQLYDRLADILRAGTGGLFYRVDRSRAYSEMFNRILPDVNEYRIEGWEPYTEFVRRRLQNLFDHLKSIGDRANFVRDRLDRLIELSRAQKMEELTRVAANGGAALIALAIFNWFVRWLSVQTMPDWVLTSLLIEPAIGLVGFWALAGLWLLAATMGFVGAFLLARKVLSFGKR